MSTKMRRTDRQEKSIRPRFIRGQILKLLQKNRPADLSADMLWELLDLRNYSITEKELLNFLTYLDEKGYITLQAERLSPEEMDTVMITLTARGTDLLEGSIADDEGIEV